MERAADGHSLHGTRGRPTSDQGILPTTQVGILPTTQVGPGSADNSGMSTNTERASEVIEILRRALSEQAVTLAEDERRVDEGLTTYIRGVREDRLSSGVSEL